MNFKINQNNGIIESNVPDDVVELLYQETKNYNSHNQESLRGRIEITRGFQDAVDFLNVNYSNLIVTSKFDPYIRFKDSIMEAVLIQALLNNGNIGDGIGLTISNLNTASSSFSASRNQFYNNYKLHTVDIGSLDKIYLGTGALFRECNLMTNLILRKDSVIPIQLDTDRMSNITSWTYNYVKYKWKNICA